MWLIYAILHMFFMALVNYSDEWLTHSSTTTKTASIHQRIGGVLVMSTFMCFVGASVLSLFLSNFTLDEVGLALTLLSSIFMVATWAGYFYLFQTFSAHQVVPLFGLSSIWLLGLELSAGATITAIALCGICILIFGAYLLDNGTLKIKVPSKLLIAMLPTSFCWAITMFLVKLASESNDALTIYFWQLVGIIFIGFMLFFLISPYRKGFIGRIKNEKYKFVIPSLINESCSQLSFMFSTLAVAVAPLAVYFTASGGIQSIFLLMLFHFFPLHERNSVSKAQWLGVVCVGLGITLLEMR